jgi:hypothetical protein
MRRLVTGHGLLSLAFNTVIVAIVVATLVSTLARGAAGRGMVTSPHRRGGCAALTRVAAY